MRLSREDILDRIAGAYRRLGFDASQSGPGVDSLDLAGELFAPDLVVLQHGRPIRLVAVETDASLGTAAALRWRSLEKAGIPLYICVPEDLYGAAWALKFECRVGGELRSVESDFAISAGRESA